MDEAILQIRLIILIRLFLLYLLYRVSKFLPNLAIMLLIVWKAKTTFAEVIKTKL